jgi:hypothetical protein
MTADEGAQHAGPLFFEQLGRAKHVWGCNRRRHEQDESWLRAGDSGTLDYAFLLEALELGGVEAEVLGEDLVVVLAEQRRTCDLDR